MQPGMPAQGFERATSRPEISTNCSGRQRAITRSTSVPHQASATSIRPFERASVDTAPAISAHCTANLIPGYSGASIGVCSAVVTASNQRALSKPTLSLTRRLSPLLKASSAWSISSSCAAIRVAPDEPSLEARVSSRRARVSTPPRPSHSVRHWGKCSSRVSADGGPAFTWSRRMIAYSKVLSAAMCRTLTWRSPFCAGLALSACRAEATISSTPKSTGTRPMLAATASCSSVSRRRSAMRAFAFYIEVDGEPEHRHVHHERCHAEADERQGNAGQRNHGKIACHGHRKLAKRKNDPRDAEPAHERLVVVAHPAIDPDEAGLAAGCTPMAANECVQPNRGGDCQHPSRRPAELAHHRSERVVALDLCRHPGARACRPEAAPRDRSRPESRRGRGPLKPSDKGELVVGRREWRRKILEPCCRDIVERTESK